MTTTVVKVPAGKYWVGDPCYSIPDEEWMPWLEAADYTINDRHHILVADLGEGRYAVGVSTQFGDGYYSDNEGRGYGVDAGLIGLVSQDWPGAGAKYYPRQEGIRYPLELPNEITVSYSEDGTITFGDLSIYTGDVDDDYDYDEADL